MKWLIYFLLLANAIFFAWQYQQLQRQSEVVIPLVSESDQVNRLLFLSEIDPATLKPVVEPRESPPETVNGETGEQDKSLAFTPSKPERTELPASVTQDAPKTEPSTTLVVEQIPSPRKVVRSTLAPVEARVVEQAPREESSPLLHDPVVGKGRAAPGSKAEEQKPVIRKCYTLGPFPEKESVEKLVGWLGDHEGQVQERWISQRKPRSYWVYLPPYPSIEEARAMLQALKEDGIKDFLRVIKGPSVNAISLGLFGKRESAEQRVRLLRRRGYKPEMKIRYDDFRERWLDVEFIRDGDFPDQAFLAEYSLLLPIGQPCR